MNIRTLDKLKIENANNIIKGFSNLNPNLRKCSCNISIPIFNFREIGMKSS